MTSEGKLDLPWTEPSHKFEAYKASCHCGAVRFNFTLSPPLYATENASDGQHETVRCNCSICTRNGFLLVYPFVKDIEWIDDSENNMAEYLMGSKTAPQKFCYHCGSSIGPDLSSLARACGQSPRFAVNVRMIKDIDLTKLKYKDTNGKDLSPPYESPV